MAADSYLLEHASQPTLRLYSWDRPCLSLGYHQRWVPSNLVEVVRRPSGGRAVLHQHEITYAIALPDCSGSVQQVYQELTGLWLETLSRLTPLLGQASVSGRSGSNPSCYQLTQRGEICLAGRKLIGSAQVRRGRRLLQHGSIPLAIDSQLFQAIFPGASEPAALGPLSCDQLVEAFPQALQRQDWDAAERAEIAAAL